MGIGRADDACPDPVQPVSRRDSAQFWHLRRTADHGVGVAAGVSVRVVAPIGLPIRPLAGAARFRAQAALPEREDWHGLDVSRPRFTTLPGTGGRFHVMALRRALGPVLDRLWDEQRFDVIDASFFFPDGPAAVALGRRYGVPVSIKARGADIHHWGRVPATRVRWRARRRRRTACWRSAMRWPRMWRRWACHGIGFASITPASTRPLPADRAGGGQTGAGRRRPLVISLGR